MHEYPISPLPRATIHEYFHLCKPIPKQLTVRGVFPTNSHMKWLAVVGSRHNSLYGRLVCEQLISGLADYPIIIVSGLAHGIDTIAHTTALSCGITCVAFPGSGLHESVIYPRRNFYLAQKILEHGGCLISEYDEQQKTADWIFPMRNRLIAGCAHATLIIECTNESGTRITAKLATEYNRDVMAVPGNINQRLSEGPNELIKLGAIPITSSLDILYALGIAPRDTVTTIPQNSQRRSSKRSTRVAIEPTSTPPLFELFPITPDHTYILSLLTAPTHKNELIRQCSSLNVSQITTLLTELELMNKIKIVLGVIYKQ